MAYNLESLIQILEQILHPEDHGRPWILDPSRRPQIESLLSKARFVKTYFEHLSSVVGHELTSLESRIRDATYRAENIIESHLVDQLLSQQKVEAIFISPPDDHETQRIFEEMVKNIDERQKRSDASSSSDLVSPRPDLNPKKIVEGITQNLDLLRDWLMGQWGAKRQIIPIVGMGGIGKTTLARALYDDSLVVSYFDIRAWVVVSDSYNRRELLLGLLKCIIGILSDTMRQEDIVELSARLHKTLFGRRYLIVLDDVWTLDDLVETQRLFPREENGSRILVTTREQSVADYVRPKNLHHHMNLLNEIDGWTLLRKKVFAEETCPQELEEAGKVIAKDCRGLPLAIHVVGGVLSQLAQTQEAWARVARDVSSVANNDDQFSNIFSLSYDRLPNHLKPCFLYMGTFSKNYQIRSSKVIKLWLAEGFLKPILGKNLEETGTMYLKELAERNLLLDGKEENKNVKSYIMHDLVMEFCIRKALEERFLYVVTDDDDIKKLNQDDMLRMRVNVQHSNTRTSIRRIALKSNDKATFIHSLKFIGRQRSIDHHLDPELLWLDLFGLRLLRVLDVLAVELPVFPEAVQELFLLRYLAATVCLYSNLSATVSNLGNLLTMVCHQSFQYGSRLIEKIQLFDMPQLRHIKFKGRYPLFVLGDGESPIALRENLQTLSTVAIDDDFPKILEATPNLKKLGITDTGLLTFSSVIDFTCLSKLETLTCSSMSRWSTSFLRTLKFPPSLKKLTIHTCGILHDYLSVIGSLPNLEVLNFRDVCFVKQWKPREGEFQNLRYLSLAKLNLVEWIADETSYPKLQGLVIRDCPQLKEIPIDLVHIPTLEIIEVHGLSSDSALESARAIQEEKEDYGFVTLQVHVEGLFTRLSI